MRLPAPAVRTLARTVLPPAIADDDLPTWVGRLVRRLGGSVRASREGHDVVVDWTPDPRRRPAANEAVEWLQAGKSAEATVVLELLLSATPDDHVVLYNLGMVHSDAGNLDRATELLRRSLDQVPDDVNARVALGVAFLRQGKVADAVVELRQTIASDPGNPWAHRNLAAALLRSGQADEAIEHLREATRLNPRDERAWAGLGQALEQAGELEEADDAYLKTIDLAGFGDVADIAKQGRSRIAQRAMRTGSGGDLRMDAVMYCLGALERFDAMPEAQVRQVVLEIATLGQSGLDVNNPDRTYRLRMLPGDYTGLHLVSMMYVGMQQIAPEHDVGFDLAQEYAVARGMYQSKGKAPPG